MKTLNSIRQWMCAQCGFYNLESMMHCRNTECKSRMKVEG